MRTTLIRRFKAHLRNVRSGKILNRIGAGESVFFENPLQGIAFKYIPGGIGKLSKYYVKQYGRVEYEIDSNSRSILTAVLAGKPISKAKYDSYSFHKNAFWNFEKIATPEIRKAAIN